MQFQPDYSLFSEITQFCQDWGHRLRQHRLAAACCAMKPSGYWEVSNEISTSSISTTGSERCRAACRLASCKGASLSVAAGALDHRLSRGRCERHHRTPDWSMAIGEARTAIHHREPGGRCRQY